jgi:hypothetical protein
MQTPVSWGAAIPWPIKADEKGDENVTIHRHAVSESLSK